MSIAHAFRAAAHPELFATEELDRLLDMARLVRDEQPSGSWEAYCQAQPYIALVNDLADHLDYRDALDEAALIDQVEAVFGG